MIGFLAAVEKRAGGGHRAQKGVGEVKSINHVLKSVHEDYYYNTCLFRGGKGVTPKHSLKGKLGGGRGDGENCSAHQFEGPNTCTYTLLIKHKSSDATGMLLGILMRHY